MINYIKKSWWVFEVTNRKIIKNASFVIAILCTYGLYMIYAVYEDYITREGYNLLDIVLSDSRKELISEIGISMQYIVFDAVFDYTYIIMPILTAIPYITVATLGYDNNITRFELFRSGKVSYVTGNMISAMIFGGLVNLIAFSFYVLTAYIVILQEIQFPIERVVERFLCCFLFGAMSVVPAFFLSAFIRNKYIVLCVPFMMDYVYGMIFGSLGTKYHILRYIHINNASGLYKKITGEKLCCLSAYAVILLIVYVVHIIRMGRRCDCGQ